MEYNYSLQHHGVKGMKWGVRRTPAQLGRATSALGKKLSSKFTRDKKEEAKKTSAPKKTEEPKVKPKKRVQDMTDDELRKKISRIQMEKQYKDLTTPAEQTKRSRGKEFVLNVLEQSGKNVATQFTTYVMGTAINKAFANAFGDEAIINPKKGQKDK